MNTPNGHIAIWLDIFSTYTFNNKYRKCQNTAMPTLYLDVQTLKVVNCWPCKKCKKRALDMESEYGELCSMVKLVLGCIGFKGWPVYKEVHTERWSMVFFVNDSTQAITAR
ncbi:hypothetical protein MAR_028909, partial [Mya arenaria]